MFCDLHISNNTFETKVTNENNIIRIPGLELKKLYGYALASPFHFH